MENRQKEHEFVGLLNKWLRLVKNAIVQEECPHSSASSSRRSLSA